MAPFTSTKNARPLGQGNWEVSTGISPAVTLTMGRGMTDSLDLGATFELSLDSTTSLWGKYSLFDADVPVALALYGGGFRSSRGQGFFAGPVIDFQWGNYQVFFVPKYNYVDWNSDWTRDDNDGFIIRFLEERVGHYSYLQNLLGLNVWFTDGFGLSLYLHFFRKLSGSTRHRFRKGRTGGVELLFRF